MRLLRPFDRMPIPRRVAVGYGMLLVLVIALACIGVIETVWLNSWSSEYRGSIRAQAESADTVTLSAAALGGYAMAATADKDNLATYEAGLSTDIAAARNALLGLAAIEADDAEDVAAVSSLRNMVDQLDQRMSEIFAMIDTDPGGAVSRITQEVMPLATLLRTQSKAYSDNEKAQELAALNGLESTAGTMFIWVLAVVVFAIILGVVLSVRISRTIARQLRGAVTSLSSSAAEMLAIASQVAASAAQTAAATNETTATVEEVKQTAHLAREKASRVAENSQSVALGAEAGRTRTEGTISGIARIQSQMSVVAETISRLSDQTQAVGEIIAAVNDLAEQSNLLSVNASIEAAKAGDHGKGFTVVAQEVKNLAEQSKQAVAQVRTILSEIQKAGNMAVQAAEEGQEAIEAGQAAIPGVGRSTFRNWPASRPTAAQAAAQISASSRQQLAGMEQISQAMESINQASNQSVMGTRQVEDEVKQLQDLAFSLKRLVDTKATA